jgi:hypothetical protein
MKTSLPPESRPSLWNPNAAACWSLIFSPAFGAFLHARNAEVLGRLEEAKQNRIWFRATLGYLALTLVGDFLPIIPEAIYRAVGIGLLLGWYFTVGAKQVDYVKGELHSAYVRRPWSMPLLVAFGALLVFVAIALGVGLIVDSLGG